MDTVSQYLNEIARYPLLTPAQEIELGRQVQAMISLQEQQPDASTYDRTQRHIVRRGERAKNQIVICNMRLVVMVAKKYARRCLTLEMLDLIQEGALGLARAAEKFDPTRGYKFSTYAYWWIRQSISRSIQDRDRIIRLPVHKHEMVFNTKAYIANQMMATGIQPTIAQCAEALGYDAKELQHTLNIAQNLCSLDKPTNADDARDSLISLIPDEASLNDDDDYGMAEREALTEALGTLREDERDLICRLDGLNGYKQESRAALAREAGISREAIRQKYNKAIMRLRQRYQVAITMKRHEA